MSKILSHLKTNIFVYILFAMGCFLLCRSCVQSEEWRPSARDEIARLAPYFKQLGTAYQRGEWQEEYDLHMFHAIRTYNDAKEACWWLPRVNDRERARQCFTAAMSAVGCSTPTGKLVASVTTLLIHHGLDMINEWEYIQNKLYWSEYHFEMCEFYAELLHGS